MKQLKTLLLLALSALSIQVFAQNHPTNYELEPNAEGEIEYYDFVEEFPILKGVGCEALEDEQSCHRCSQIKLSSIVAKMIQYTPHCGGDIYVDGRIYIRYIITKEGKMSNIEIVKSTMGFDYFDKIALKVMHKIADEYEWIPGKEKGEAVHVRMIMPIRFCHFGHCRS